VNLVLIANRIGTERQRYKERETTRNLGSRAKYGLLLVALRAPSPFF
jgi:hypothetical protein